MTPRRTGGSSPSACGSAAGPSLPPGGPALRAPQAWHLNICGPFLVGQCPRGPRCPRHHTRYPYHWQLLRRRANQWVSLPELAQHQLERIYCAGAARVQLACSSSGDVCLLDLNGCRADSPTYERWRRLTTPDSAAESPHFFTRWRTYREVEGRWVAYEEPLATEIDVSFRSRQPRFHFAVGQVQFTVNWLSLSESDLSRGGYRKICRRPVFRSPMEMVPWLKTLPAVELPREPLHHRPEAGGLELPASWVPYPQKEGYARVPLAAGEAEYQMVYWTFHQTVAEAKYVIVGIYRIQNAALWVKYANRRAQLQEKLSEVFPPGSWDSHLFHGTSEESAGAICRVNFDPALSGKNGARYGRGACFATSAGYSHAFAVPSRAGLRRVFLAKVLTGRSARGRSGDRRPPPLAGEGPGAERYESCVNCPDNPTIYVVYDNAQCYPYWLLEYQNVNQITID